MDNPKASKIWSMFEDWALDNDIELGNRADWEPWWECWYDGFAKGLLSVETGQEVD